MISRTPNIDRRSFLVGTAAAGSGLALGLKIPFGAGVALAQRVAEELECDWSKVTTEYPTPGMSVARKRPWGDFSTGGSRGIRDSQEYVRKGGAAARMMLVQAAADA